MRAKPRGGRLRWLDHVPLIPLAIGAVFLGLAPLMPEPHLWEKLKMLVTGELYYPLDIFDLAMHAALPVLLALKIVRVIDTDKPKKRSA